MCSYTIELEIIQKYDSWHGQCLGAMSYRRRWGECRRDFRSIWYIVDVGKLGSGSGAFFTGRWHLLCGVLLIGCSSIVKPFGRFDQILFDNWIQPWAGRFAPCHGSVFPHVGCCVVSRCLSDQKISLKLILAHSKQNKIRSLKLVGFIVEGLMPIGSEEDPEDVDEDSPSRVSSWYQARFAPNADQLSLSHSLVGIQGVERPCHQYASSTSVSHCHACCCHLYAKPWPQLS